MKNTVPREMHNVPYVGHLGYQKTIAMVINKQFWPEMKKEVANCIFRCLECQKVNIEHRNIAGLLQLFLIPKLKCEVVTIDFIKNLPKKVKQHDFSMVWWIS
jgi:hypothetical protein